LSTLPNSTFKFRAETSDDVWNFLVRLYEQRQFFVKELTLTSIEVERGSYSGCEVELEVRKVNPKFRETGQPFHIAATLDELRTAAAGTENCHVIHESVNYADQYDGERYYVPSEDDDD
jgi:hypothetical protein